MKVRLKRHSKTLITLGLTAAVTAVVTAVWLCGFEPLRHAELSAQDFLVRHGRKAQWDERLTFVAIDQRSVSMDGFSPEIIEQSRELLLMAEGFPWSREVYGMILERLVEAGAKVVAFDLLFPTARSGEEGFRAALDRHREHVVIGFNFVSAARDREGERGQFTLPTEELIPSTTPLDDRLGCVNFWPDEDGVVRRARYRVSADAAFGLAPTEGEELFDTLAARTLEKTEMRAAVPGDVRARRFRFASPMGTVGALMPVSASDLFDPVNWRIRYRGGKAFRGKIVLIGPYGNWSKDEVPSPFGMMAGPLLHLNAMNAVLRGEFLQPMPRAGRWLMVLGSGIGAAGIMLATRRLVVRLAVFVGCDAAFAASCFWLYNHPGVFPLIAAPAFVFNGAAVLLLVWESVHERIERLRTRRTLERYVSRNVVRELLDNPESLMLSLGGARREVTMLFTDLRGFSALAERIESTELITQLNEYFSEMVPHIFAREGTLDKFMGDAIMAVWGNVKMRDPVTDAKDAVKTALQMEQSLAGLNARWEKLGRPKLSMGVGIHQGDAVVGNIGSIDKMELTVIGDAVNLASRLEGLTKEFGVPIVISGEVAAHVGDIFQMQKIGRVQVKGKTRPITIYAVLGHLSDSVPEDVAKYLSAFAEGLDFYERGSFTEATRCFFVALDARPDDRCASKYLHACHRMEGKVVPEKWTGVMTIETK